MQRSDHGARGRDRLPPYGGEIHSGGTADHRNQRSGWRGSPRDARAGNGGLVARLDPSNGPRSAGTATRTSTDRENRVPILSAASSSNGPGGRDCRDRYVY